MRDNLPLYKEIWNFRGSQRHIGVFYARVVEVGRNPTPPYKMLKQKEGGVKSTTFHEAIQR